MSNLSRRNLIEAVSQANQQVGNRTVIFTHVIAAHIGLSATEFECFDFLRQHGPVPTGRLCELTGLTSGAVTGLVDRLERAGFLRRLFDPRDRRKTLIQAEQDQAITAQIQALYQPASQEFQRIVEHYNNAELQVIIRYLHESLAMIDRVTASMATTKRKAP